MNGSSIHSFFSFTTSEFLRRGEENCGGQEKIYTLKSDMAEAGVSDLSSLFHSHITEMFTLRKSTELLHTQSPKTCPTRPSDSTIFFCDIEIHKQGGAHTHLTYPTEQDHFQSLVRAAVKHSREVPPSVERESDE